MANSVKKSAQDFLKKYRVKKLTVHYLSKIIKSQGYRIIRYNKAYNDENTEILINSLDLREYVRIYNAFTYSDSQYRIVFIEDGLSEEEMLILLAHEEGHIYLGHFGDTVIAGKGIRDEYEANEFSHYILNPPMVSRFATTVSNHKKLSIIISMMLLLVVGSCIAAPIAIQQSKYYGEYYVSQSGEKYHLKSCYYIRDKNNIRRVTKEEIENGEYSPCKVCLPELGE